ncbi:Organ-specific protein P4, partial [Bienertia sinuspersici]
QIDGRKGPAEYWADLIKDQPIPEAFKGLLDHRPNKNNMQGEIEVSYKSFDPIPDDMTIYHNDNFDPIPEDMTIYHNDVITKEMKVQKEDCNSHHDGPMSKKLVGADFEPRPTVSNSQ